MALAILSHYHKAKLCRQTACGGGKGSTQHASSIVSLNLHPHSWIVNHNLHGGKVSSKETSTQHTSSIVSHNLSWIANHYLHVNLISGSQLSGMIPHSVSRSPTHGSRARS